MSVWQRDYTKRLSKVEIDIFPIELHNSELEFLNDSIDMADDEGSNHEDEFENQADQPVKSHRDYLQPTRSSTPSYVVAPVNTGNFDIKPGESNCCLSFVGLILKILTCISRNLIWFVLCILVILMMLLN
jgi:hypothetical protein